MTSLPTSRIERRPLLAIALVSFAVLFFQIAATRILSVVLWYHWAFLSVSIAMLGVGAPGVWFAVRAPGPRWLATSLVLGGLTLPLAVLAMPRWGHEFGVVFCMACLAVPMLLLGSAVCLLLLQAPGAAVARMYGADLAGAAVAAALVIPVLHVVPTPSAAAMLGVLPLLAAWQVGGIRLDSVAALAAAITALAFTGDTLEVRHNKAYDEREIGKPVYVRWSPTARLAFFERGSGAFGWGFGANAPPVAVEQFWMEQDAGAGTAITRWNGDPGDMSGLRHLLADVTSFGYQVRPPARVAVIGSGGGRDVLTALLAGARDVDAVELNSHVVDVVSTRFREFAGDVYHAPGVHAQVSEGRSFLTRSPGEYDLIQISLTDSWAATAAGAFALAENNLYTSEAYQLYLQRLAPAGLIATSRWAVGAESLELLRLLFLNQHALRALGVQEPNEHLIVARGGTVGTVLTSKRPFTAAEREHARAVCAERGFELLFPAPPRPERPADVPTLLRDGPGSLAARGLYMAPPTDDHPFFFQSLPIFGGADLEFARRFGVNTEAVLVLRQTMLILGVAALALFFAPFLLARWLPRGAGFWRGSGYFAAIGVAFMFTEIPWLQRFVLYLGHPSFAATVVLGSLLLGLGVGAMLSVRVGLPRLQRSAWLAPAVLGLANLALPALFQATLGATLAVRVALSVAVLVPVGLLLGQFFPLGMLRFGDPAKAWFWAMNGAFGVLASVTSLALAMAFGFSAVAWIGVAGYLAAALLIRKGADSALVTG